MSARRRSEGGQDLIEFALVLPLLLLLLLGIMEFGIIIFTYNTIANAAREGARVGILPSSDEIAAEDAAQRLTSGLNQDDDVLYIDAGFDEALNTVSVTVAYTHTLIAGPILQAVGVNEIPLRSVATMQRE